jgi:hypothetical protein
MPAVPASGIMALLKFKKPEVSVGSECQKDINEFFGGVYWIMVPPNEVETAPDTLVCLTFVP